MTTLSSLRLSNDRAFSGTGLDSAGVLAVAGTGLTVYSTLDSLPVSSLTAGDQAYVQANKRLYISNGSGWYNVALINLSPTMSLDQSGTIALTAESLTSTVTITAQDSDNPEAILSYSVESDGNMLATGVTVSQDSSVFTITAASQDSGGVTGSFDLTFKVSDQINQASEALSFTLTFSNVIDSSAETVLLMKASGNNLGNTTITYVNSADIESTWTTTGTVTASSFSPYRSGGYSYYFNGSSYIQFAASNDWGFGYNPWAVEFWYKGTDTTGDVVSAFNAAQPHAGFSVSIQSGLIKVFLSDGTGSDGYDTVSGTTTVNDNEWHHVAVTSDDGNVVRCHIDGVRVDGGGARGISFTEAPATTGQILRVGTDTNTSPIRQLTGYLRDVHVTGSELYPQSNFTPPTEPITATADTVLLTCQNAYMKENSTSDRTVTVSGNVETLPIGPYDYEPWTTDDGGSIYFNGEGNYLSHTTPSDIQTLGQQNQSMTIEAWIRPTGAPTNYAYIYGIGTNGSTAGSNLYGLEIGTSYQLRGAVNGAYTTAAGMPITANNVITPNAWNHVALVQNAGNWTIYVNGKSEATQGNTSYMSGTAHSTGFVGRSHYDDNRYWPGYVSNLRIHDTAVYTSAFTPPTSPVTTPKLLLNQAGANANIYDAAAGNVFTLVGNTQSSTTQRKWTGSSAIVFDGSGDYITIDTDNFGRITANEPFTIEGWFRFDDITGQALFHFTDTPGTLNDVLYVSGSSNLSFYANNGDVTPNSGGGLSIWNWYHIAMTRHTDNKIRVFIGGTLKNTSSGTYADLVPRYLEIGRYGNNVAPLDGYVQDVRITKGRARYTATFTAPTAEFEL